MKIIVIETKQLKNKTKQTFYGYFENHGSAELWTKNNFKDFKEVIIVNESGFLEVTFEKGNTTITFADSQLLENFDESQMKRRRLF